MKQLIHKIWICALLVLLASCSSDESIWKNEVDATVKLHFTEGVLPASSSRTVDDTDMERAISHLDVFFFDAADSNPKDVIHKRITNPVTEGDDEEGTVSLDVPLSEFKDRERNHVYVIANAKDGLNDITTIAGLLDKVQEDERIHVTGTSAIGAPQYFLMDGKAYLQDSSSDELVTIDSDSKDDVVLNVTLKRAAAKVVVTLKQSTEENCLYKFLKDEARNYEKGYYFRNMPYKTKIIGGQEEAGAYPEWGGNNPDYIRMPDKANDSAFEWCPENEEQETKVVVTAYLYSHKWKNEDTDTYYARGTSLVVNIPMWEDANNNGHIDQDEEVYENSYYQIPIVEKNKDSNEEVWQIDRNTIYELTATIAAPGAEDSKKPLELEIDFNTYEWVPKAINVSGDEVNYLEVNKTVVEMFNVAEDATLTFTSSAPVTVTLTEQDYYYNKYGQKTEYSVVDPTFVYDTKALSGTINIRSSIPENLTAKYFTLRVSNGNISKEVKVIQYPVICVSNQLGYYSYREDFGFNWESSSQNNAYVSVGANNTNGIYTGNYYGTSGSSSYFFSSKVIEQNPSSSTSKYDSYFYRNGRNGATRGDRCEENRNLRMYQMQVMATSSDYVVGRPRLNDEGYTDKSEDNNRLVSPSFMIASRLGAVYSGKGGTSSLDNGGSGGLKYENGGFIVVNSSGSSGGGMWDDNPTYSVEQDELLKFYADHCKNYVEVVGTGSGQKVYKDWHLPTAAEIQFIIAHQGTSQQDAEAIDYLLNGAFYYSAMGPIYNSKKEQNQDGKAIRCIHDVYDSNLVISKKE